MPDGKKHANDGHTVKGVPVGGEKPSTAGNNPLPPPRPPKNKGK